MERLFISWKNPANIYLFKVKKRNTRERCEICSELTIKTLMSSDVFTVNFKYISQLFLVILLLNLRDDVNVIFPIGSNFQIVSTLPWGNKIQTLGNPNFLPKCFPAVFAYEKLFLDFILFVHLLRSATLQPSFHRVLLMAWKTFILVENYQIKFLLIEDNHLKSFL